MPAAAPSKSRAGGVLVGAGSALADAAAYEAPDRDDAEGGASGALARRTTVRHYTQMNPGRTYPLLVIISAGKVEKVVMREVAQVESATGFTVTRESPMVRIEPVLPGCAVAPTSIDIDCAAALAEAKFHVTPIVEGDVPEARVEVRHEGKVIDSVPVPTRIAKQTIAKVSASLSVVSPVALQLLKLADSGAIDRDSVGGIALSFVQGAAHEVGGAGNLGLVVAGIGAVFAAAAWWTHRAREGSPIVRFLDYSAALPAQEDLAVVRLKAGVAVLGEGARALHPIRKRKTVIGRAPGCDIVVPDRSVEERHAEIEFDGSMLRIRALAGAAMAVEGRTAPAADLVGDEVALKLGSVPLLYYRDARSDALDDARAGLERILVAKLPGFSDDIRERFSSGEHARTAAVRLMVAGKLDLETWRNVKGGVAG